MFGCESDTSIAFLVLACNFITKAAKVPPSCHILRERRLSLSLFWVIFATLRPSFIFNHSGKKNKVAGWQAPVSQYGWLLCQGRKVEVGRTKQITIMEPSAQRPCVYDGAKARVQFHQRALLSGELRRNHNYALLLGLPPLSSAWRPLPCLPFFGPCQTRTTDRKWMRIMAAYLMDLPATVFTPRLDMSTSPLFPSLLLKNLHPNAEACILGRTRWHSWQPQCSVKVSRLSLDSRHSCCF